MTGQKVQPIPEEERNLTLPQRFSLRRRARFIQILSSTGRVMKAARAVGYADTSYLHRLRREDEEFADEWDAAVEASFDVIESEAKRRAVTGVVKDVYYKGKRVGKERIYSDSLLTTMLKAGDPDKYNRGTDSKLTVEGMVGVAVLPMTSVSPEDWEKVAVEMHSAQPSIPKDVVVDAECEVVSVDRPTKITRGE
jgi:hypothetical protein